MKFLFLSLFLSLFFLIFAVSTIAMADSNFNPQQLLPPFDPIVDPDIAGSGEASEWVEDDELVLGVSIGDEARAYPINMLTQPTREIINDRLGGRDIAATW